MCNLLAVLSYLMSQHTALLESRPQSTLTGRYVLHLCWPTASLQVTEHAEPSQIIPGASSLGTLIVLTSKSQPLCRSLPQWRVLDHESPA